MTKYVCLRCPEGEWPLGKIFDTENELKEHFDSIHGHTPEEVDPPVPCAYCESPNIRRATRLVRDPYLANPQLPICDECYISINEAREYSEDNGRFEDPCPSCGGTGQYDDVMPCEDCDGTGVIE